MKWYDLAAQPNAYSYRIAIAHSGAKNDKPGMELASQRGLDPHELRI